MAGSRGSAGGGGDRHFTVCIECVDGCLREILANSFFFVDRPDYLSSFYRVLPSE